MSVPSSPVPTVPEILIVGGTGHVGLETIIALARDKSSRRYSVKAACRNVVRGNKMLDAFGVGTVYMDLGKPETIAPALSGITKVFLVVSYNSYKTEHAASLIGACKQAESLEHLVVLSVSQCENKSSHYQKQFKQIEEMLEDSSLKWTRLRAAFFMENFVSMEKNIKDSKVILPIENARFAPVSVSDVGEVAANILLCSPGKHAYKTYTLTGPQLLTGEEVAQTFGNLFGKKFDFLSPSREAAKMEYLKNGMEKNYVDMLMEILDSISRREQETVSSDAEILLGRSPVTLEQVMVTHKNHFLSRPPELCTCPV